MINVVNINNTSCTHYCGQLDDYLPKYQTTDCTILKNPYSLKRDSNETKLKKYKIWFNIQLILNMDFNLALQNIILSAKKGTVLLGCSCAPQACHCDIIKEHIEQNLKYY